MPVTADNISTQELACLTDIQFSSKSIVFGLRVVGLSQFVKHMNSRVMRSELEDSITLDETAFDYMNINSEKQYECCS